MCGRYVMKAKLKELQEKYDAVPAGLFSLEGNYNVAPTTPMPVLLEKGGSRIIDLFRWGLVPFWAKDEKISYSMINARSETLASKRTFSKPFKSQRCIVPASGFYEWKKTSKGKMPHYIHRKSSDIMNFAGLYEHWKSPDGKEVDSYTIITTSAADSLKELHDRMPAMLLDEEISFWLDPENQDVNALQDLLRTWPEDDVQFHRVNQEANNVRNKGAHLIEPAEDLFS